MSQYPETEEPRLRYLKSFQSERLRHTYRDFIAVPAYQPTCHFFFNRLYGTEDFADRDKAFKNIYQIARRFLGGEVVTSMKELIALEDLTLMLDDRLLQKLIEMDAPEQFDMETYETAYAACGNRLDRLRQIELLESTMRLVHRISHRFGIGMVLKALHGACVIFGDTRMVDFLMDGYRAFLPWKNIDPLVGAMVYRERQRLDRIFGLPHDETW